jgi:hypothetical protein
MRFSGSQRVKHNFALEAESQQNHGVTLKCDLIKLTAHPNIHLYDKRFALRTLLSCLFKHQLTRNMLTKYKKQN